MKKIIIWLTAGLVLILGLTACKRGPRVIMAPGYEQNPAFGSSDGGETVAVIPTEDPAEDEVEAEIIPENVYLLSSRLLSFVPIQGWINENDKPNYVKFREETGEAWFEVAIETTGYTLDEGGFDNYASNLHYSLYAEADEFIIDESISDEGERRFLATFILNGVQWKTLDIIIQRNEIIYLLSFHAPAELWDDYSPQFIDVYESLTLYTGYGSSGDYLYAFSKTYRDPGEVFAVRRPMGWAVTGVEIIGGRTRRQAIVSPDGKSQMLLMIYDAEVELTSYNIGQTAIGLLRELIIDDLTIESDGILDDGRIRLDWISPSTNATGFSFFWLNNPDLYLLTFMHDNHYPGVNQEINYRIGDSFRFTAN